jgi:hypothetical protein
MYRRLLSSSAATLFALLLLAAPSAFAQSAASPSAEYAQRVRTQITGMLKSDNPDVQKQGISLIQQFAERPERPIDPTYFAERLSRMYFDRQRDDDVRMSALDALHAMDSLENRVSQIVQNLRSDPSDAVRAHTLQVLSNYNATT